MENHLKHMQVQMFVFRQHYQTIYNDLMALYPSVRSLKHAPLVQQFEAAQQRMLALQHQQVKALQSILHLMDQMQDTVEMSGLTMDMLDAPPNDIDWAAHMPWVFLDEEDTDELDETDEDDDICESAIRDADDDWYARDDDTPVGLPEAVPTLQNDLSARDLRNLFGLDGATEVDTSDPWGGLAYFGIYPTPEERLRWSIAMSTDDAVEDSDDANDDRDEDPDYNVPGT